MRQGTHTLAFAIAALGLVLVTATDASANEHPEGKSGPTETQDILGRGKSGPMLMMPMMNPANGRKLFASKGCVVCHSVNGIGGEDAPPLDASTMQQMMNPFEFAARMWRGAEAMIYLQQEELGEQIDFTGQELGDIIAFTHFPEEQKKFSAADIPLRIQRMMHHKDEEEHEEPDEAHEEKEGAHGAD